ncbi:hypothetical protein ACU686_20790 [Yinghuangia aomiensis]
MLKLNGKHMRRGMFIMSVQQGVTIMRELEDWHNRTCPGNRDGSGHSSADR